MSDLQNRAKGVMEPLLDGKWTVLSADAQKIIARWSVMFHMVLEMTDPGTAGSSPDERKLFADRQITNNNWVIMIGKSGDKNNDGFFNHYMWRGEYRDHLHQKVVFITQSTGFCIGDLVFYMFSSVYEQLNFAKFAKTFGLDIIHPYQVDIIGPPSVSYTYSFLEKMSSAIPGSLRGSASRFLDEPLSRSMINDRSIRRISQFHRGGVISFQFVDDFSDDFSHSVVRNVDCSAVFDFLRLGEMNSGEIVRFMISDETNYVGRGSLAILNRYSVINKLEIVEHKRRIGIGAAAVRFMSQIANAFSMSNICAIAHNDQFFVRCGFVYADSLDEYIISLFERAGDITERNLRLLVKELTP